MAKSWKNLGLIHILVVSGGHLSILAAILVHISRVRVIRTSPQTAPRAWWTSLMIGAVLTTFCLGNRLQPPVLRALLEWLCHSRLERRGWRSPEIGLMTTWLALPFCSTIFDLLSLALSFFASVVVEQTARSLHRRPLVSIVALQIAVWWILMPLLFTMGLPHPLATMTNIVLAPVLGATLIPFAMLVWLSGAMPAVSGLRDDPVYLGSLFDLTWRYLSEGVTWLADVLPAATPRISNAQPLLLGFEGTSVLMFAVFSASGALLIRSRRGPRREDAARSATKPVTLVVAALAASLVLHHVLSVR